MNSTPVPARTPIRFYPDVEVRLAPDCWKVALLERINASMQETTTTPKIRTVICSKRDSETFLHLISSNRELSIHRRSLELDRDLLTLYVENGTALLNLTSTPREEQEVYERIYNYFLKTGNRVNVWVFLKHVHKASLEQMCDEEYWTIKRDEEEVTKMVQVTPGELVTMYCAWKNDK